MKKIKVCVLTAMYKRHDVFKMYAKSMKRLTKETSDIIDWTVIIAGSEGKSSRKLAEKNGFEYIEVPNAPLGRKLNARLQYAKQFNPDYILGMGSDDILTTPVIEAYYPYLLLGIDFIGLLDIYYMDLNTKEMIFNVGYTNHRKGETIGAGRMISKKILDAVDYKLWADDRNSSLDASMTAKLKDMNIVRKSLSLRNIKGGMLLDLKSEVNIGSFNIRPEDVPLMAYRFLPAFLKKKECKMIIDHEPSIIEECKAVAPQKKEPVKYEIPTPVKEENECKLSVLVPTLYDRVDEYNKLVDTVFTQINKYGLEDSVEFLKNRDDGEASIGEKRNTLLANAKGKYVVFVDDDDRIAEDYIPSILAAIMDDSDCITFNGKARVNEGPESDYNFDVAAKKYSFSKNNGYRRPPGHLTPIKASIAKQFKFSTKMKRGSDVKWSSDINKSGLIKSSSHINKYLYFYDRVHNGTA